MRLRRVAWVMAVAGVVAAWGCAAPSRPTGLTRVASTASCAPCQRGRPCARISMARPSAGGGSRFMWARGTCMCTRAPASRRMRAKVLSIGTARVRKAPLVAHAARWSPNASKGRPQRQRAGANPNGRRSRRRSRVR